MWKLFAGIALGYTVWAWCQPTPTPPLSAERRISQYLGEASHRGRVRYMDRQRELFGERQPRNPWVK